MAAALLLPYAKLHDLGLTPLQYGQGFGAPCFGAILAPRWPGHWLIVTASAGSCLVAVDGTATDRLGC